MNKLELFVLRFTGTIIVWFGFLGSLLTIYIDEIRARPFELGYLQVVGIVVFSITMLFGIFVNKFLGQVKELLERYLKQ